VNVRDDLPTGTVTFLFTDIEASTRLLDEIGSAAGQWLRVRARNLDPARPLTETSLQATSDCRQLASRAATSSTLTRLPFCA
jgi:hypothetical protein